MCVCVCVCVCVCECVCVCVFIYYLSKFPRGKKHLWTSANNRNPDGPAHPHGPVGTSIGHTIQKVIYTDFYKVKVQTCLHICADQFGHSPHAEIPRCPFPRNKPHNINTDKTTYFALCY